MLDLPTGDRPAQNELASPIRARQAALGEGGRASPRVQRGKSPSVGTYMVAFE